ncbi:MAG: hypothetical protein IJM39_06505 [Firmicutes bacterium]|nr:hypothetical protein [Bacillota bacterium]
MEDKIPDTIPKDPVPEAASAAEEKPKKKRRKWPLVLLIIIIILGAGGYYVYQNLPSTQAQKHVKASQEYYQANDLDKAAAELLEAKRLMPEKSADYDSMISSYYNTTLETLLSEEKFEDALKLIEKEKTLLPDRKDQFDAAAASYYTLWADKVLRSGDQQQIAAMSELIDSLPGELKSAALLEKKAQIDTAISEYMLNTSYKEFSDKIIKLINEENWDKVYSDIRSDLFTAFGAYRNIVTTVAVSGSNYLPLISEADSSGNSLGLYYVDNLYFLYYGEYKDGKRNGKGTWITVVNKLNDETYRNYRCECEWADDMPNGDFAEFDAIKLADAEKARNRFTSGTTDLGLYSGKITYKYDGSSEMYGTFQNGHPAVIMNQDPNGEHAFVIAISEDQRYWVTNREGANGIHGILGFK